MSNATTFERHVLVTGASRGIGERLAARFAREGARLTLCGRDPETISAAAARIPGSVGIAADVTDETSVEQLFAQAREAHGPVSVVIANAGGSESAPISRTTIDAWNATLAVNLTGVFLCFRAGLADMQERSWGRLICIASTAGLKGYGYVTPYCAAKHGAVGLTRSLALELAKTPITVNAICPGFTETPMLTESIQRIVDTTGRSEEQARTSLRRINPQDRFIDPDEIADTAHWLCSDAARSITGQALAVAGGEV